MNMRVGTGLDFHRLIQDPERPLLLGGVEIPGDLALDGHSDADVLLHALSDAILGALGKGDIGEHFPDTDARYKNLDSTKILHHALDAMRKERYEISNVDITLIGERPRLHPYRLLIRESLMFQMDLELVQIGLKATTTEKMGALGRAEGLGCIASVLLYRSAGNAG
ncbi:MAG: 2-C-methyl-D-erythritol 2,4-cyclodiphosphate synthase [Leptospiraceae bacterium]|nr:2-C-methyl-D-erythritol 2,4-cyclodiphosphate synthase [Leptospiraceae bacterium]MCB1317881.1 2-C-methyl-D-erythritol 2,4-cyclodiphosphate synthase [Leptospiraceae bacterium]MCB1323032.1 2-C-methyl-D-erythritol 2,4-cyclodiphosphate synthase [Leptospiraceae bacterium]